MTTFNLNSLRAEQDATFELTIVPTSYNQAGQSIDLYGPESTFYVVLKNTSKKTTRNLERVEQLEIL